MAFLCHFLTQKATGRPNHTILTLVVNAIQKAITSMVFFVAPSLGEVTFFFFYGSSFFNKREYSGADWLDLLISNCDCDKFKSKLLLKYAA